MRNRGIVAAAWLAWAMASLVGGFCVLNVCFAIWDYTVNRPEEAWNCLTAAAWGGLSAAVLFAFGLGMRRIGR